MGSSHAVLSVCAARQAGTDAELPVGPADASLTFVEDTGLLKVKGRGSGAGQAPRGGAQSRAEVQDASLERIWRVYRRLLLFRGPLTTCSSQGG